MLKRFAVLVLTLMLMLCAHAFCEDGAEPEATQEPVLYRFVTTELEDGTLRILVTFEDPSYRMVDYWGDDIGLVYDYDTYVRNYPWLLDEFGDDREAVMEYFCDEGMYEGHVANDFFNPSWILLCNPDLGDMFGEDWQIYYWDFLSYGHDEGWLYATDDGFRPEVQDAL